jgi:hypothetical protein
MLGKGKRCLERKVEDNQRKQKKKRESKSMQISMKRQKKPEKSQD